MSPDATGEPIWQLAQDAASPVIAAAIHDGSRLRDELEPLLMLSPGDRLREEDPHTGRWARLAGTHVIGLQSRFEVDLNRPRDKAVYQVPEDAWGLELYQNGLPAGIVERSLDAYDAFYREMHRLLSRMAERHGRLVVLDLHTYNHRRGGPDAAPDDPEANPEVNIGTGTMPDRARWAPIINRFIADLGSFPFGGHHLDVRENVKFQGGNFGRWMHSEFPDSVCCLSIEFKKFFMDEWTGTPDEDQVQLIEQALAATLPGLTEELSRISDG